MLEDNAGTQATSNSMTRYMEAVAKFTDSATTFMKQVQHLTQARDAYQQALLASAEMRNILDTGDEILKNHMTQLEQALTSHMGRVLDKKQPESVKIEATRRREERTAVLRAWP
jgi:uncharacterized UPF0160 family protein